MSAHRRHLLWSFTASAGILFSFPALGADESAPVPKPDVKEGETWTYQFTNLVANVRKPVNVQIRVSFVSAGVIATIDRIGDGQEGDSQYTAEWNPSAQASGQVYKEPFRRFRFPLKVGDSYPFTYEVAFRGSPNRSKSEGTFKVVGWEDVVVPAGKFRALKIEGRGAYQRLDTRGGALQRWDIWYVPEVKRHVKDLYEDGPPGGNPDTKRLFELTGFKVQ